MITLRCRSAMVLTTEGRDQMRQRCVWPDSRPTLAARCIENGATDGWLATRRREGEMAGLMGRAAAFYGTGKPMEIKEYPVPDPEPGAIVVKTTLTREGES